MRNGERRHQTINLLSGTLWLTYSSVPKTIKYGVPPIISVHARNEDKDLKSTMDPTSHTIAGKTIGRENERRKKVIGYIAAEA
jgi:hypothetical protein